MLRCSGGSNGRAETQQSGRQQSCVDTHNTMDTCKDGRMQLCERALDGSTYSRLERVLDQVRCEGVDRQATEEN